MSGVAALLALEGQLADGSARIGEGMLARLAHRGPDGQARRRFASAWIAHALLATTEDDTGWACSDDGRLVVASDARIDNRDEVAAQLGRRTTTDAETILAAYERWGDACAGRLVGDFAFLVWDDRRQRLLCARDRVGVRTLFWTLRGGVFRCGSDMDALFADSEVPRRPHLDSLALFLAEEYLERDQTLYEGVFALAAAHVMTLAVGDTAPTVRSYWSPEPTRVIRYRARGDYMAHFRTVFEDAVVARLRSKTAPNVLVSGGLDSSALVGAAEAARRAGSGGRHPVTMVHMAFPGLACDEREYGNAVAERWGLEVVTVRADGLTMPVGAAAPAIDRLGPDHYFNPVDMVFEQHLTASRLRGSRVTLTGVGSDQLMQRTGAELSDALFDGRIAAVVKFARMRDPWSPRAWMGVARRAVSPILPRVLRDQVLRWRPSQGAIRPWMAPRFRAAVTAHRERSRRRLEGRSSATRAGASLAHQLVEGYECGLGLSVLGRLAARFGSELRHPYLDSRLIELVVAFPNEVRCGLDETKPLIREGLGDLLPHDVRTRRGKAEFSPFIHRVLFGGDGTETTPFLAALGPTSRLAALGLVAPQDVDRLVCRVRRDWSRLRDVASLVALELWLRQTFE